MWVLYYQEKKAKPMDKTIKGTEYPQTHLSAQICLKEKKTLLGFKYLSLWFMEFAAWFGLMQSPARRGRPGSVISFIYRQSSEVPGIGAELKLRLGDQVTCTPRAHSCGDSGLGTEMLGP